MKTVPGPLDDKSPDPLLPDVSCCVDQIGDRFLDLLHAGDAPARIEILAAYRLLLQRLEQRLALIELMFASQRDR